MLVVDLCIPFCVWPTTRSATSDGMSDDSRVLTVLLMSCVTKGVTLCPSASDMSSSRRAFALLQPSIGMRPSRLMKTKSPCSIAAGCR